MSICSKNYPDAKVIDCDSGNVIGRLYDTFAAGSQPLSVCLDVYLAVVFSLEHVNCPATGTYMYSVVNF